MQQLHLVGLTDDREGLILSARKGSKSGGYVVALDEHLTTTIDEALRLRDDSDGERSAPARRRSKPLSTLTPREIQARLRAGRDTAAVAAEAGVDEEWVLRFAAPILGEQAQVVKRAQHLTYAKPRRGESSKPLGVAVQWNLAEKGLRLPDDVYESAWSAYNLHGTRWVVRLSYTSRQRRQTPEWEVDVRTGELTARNRLASDLGYVEPGRHRKRLPAGEGATTESIDGGPPEATAERRTAVTKKAAVKRAAAKKAAVKKAAAKKAAVKKAAAEKAAAKRAGATTVATKAGAGRASAGKAGAERTAAAGRRAAATSTGPAVSPEVSAGAARGGAAGPGPARPAAARSAGGGSGRGRAAAGAAPRRASRPAAPTPADAVGGTAVASAWAPSAAGEEPAEAPDAAKPTAAKKPTAGKKPAVGKKPSARKRRATADAGAPVPAAAGTAGPRRKRAAASPGVVAVPPAGASPEGEHETPAAAATEAEGGERVTHLARPPSPMSPAKPATLRRVAPSARGSTTLRSVPPMPSAPQDSRPRPRRSPTASPQAPPASPPPPPPSPAAAPPALAPRRTRTREQRSPGEGRPAVPGDAAAEERVLPGEGEPGAPRTGAGAAEASEAPEAPEAPEKARPLPRIPPPPVAPSVTEAGAVGGDEGPAVRILPTRTPVTPRASAGAAPGGGKTAPPPPAGPREPGPPAAREADPGPVWGGPGSGEPAPQVRIRANLAGAAVEGERDAGGRRRPSRRSTGDGADEQRPPRR